MDFSGLLALVTGGNNDDIEFKDFKSSDIPSLGLLDNASFSLISEWGGEAPFKGEPSGFNNAKYASLKGTYKGTTVEFFIAEQKDTKTDKDGKVTTHYYYKMFMDFDLAFCVPHVKVSNSKKTIFTGKARNGVIVNFGEKFSDFFTVEAVKGQEQKAFEMLPPDTMLEIMQEAHNSEIQYHMNSIRINFNFNIEGVTDSLTRGFFQQVTKEDFVHQFNKILSISNELIHSAKTAAIKPEEFKKLGTPISTAGVIFGIGFATVTASVVGIVQGWLPFEFGFAAFGVLFVTLFVMAIVNMGNKYKRNRRMVKEGWTPAPKANRNPWNAVILAIAIVILAGFFLSFLFGSSVFITIFSQ